MGYFALRCFSPQVGKYVLLGLNILIALLGVTHWGYAGSYGALKSSIMTSLTLDQSTQRLYDSPIAYFAISGIVQVLVSVLVILLIMDIIGQQNKLLWARIVLIALVFEFGFDFFIAVYTSMMSNYFTSSFKQYLDATQTYVSSLTGNTLTLWSTIKNFVRFSYAQAIITWILSIPAVSIVIVSLTDQLLNENTANQLGKFEIVQGSQLQQVGQRSMITTQPINGNLYQPNQANTTLNDLMPQQQVYGQQPVYDKPQPNKPR